MIINLERWLTPEAAAARMGASVATIWRRVRQGSIHPRRLLGRTLIDAREVDALKDGDDRKTSGGT
jgi:hypothetical protein